MGNLSAGIVVLIAIIAAAAVVAIAAAMHKVYSNRGRSDLEGAEGMIPSMSNEQSHYMRDVRMRGQLQAWGVAPAYEGLYEPPRSQVGGARTGSRGGDTTSNFG